MPHRSLRPAVFDLKTRSWLDEPLAPLVTGPADREPARFTIVTWNVWFAPLCFEQRFRALLERIHAHDPHLICLQEILPESLAMLLETPWIRGRYRVSDATGDSLDGYGVVLLSRLPLRSISLHDLPSSMGRRLLVAEAVFQERPFFVATVHLESLKWSRHVRAEQLGVVFPIVKSIAPDGLLVGDFNFCSTWKEENDAIDNELVDLWPALRGREPGWTADTSVNVMLRNVKRKDKQVRYDRILLRSSRGGLRATSIELLGTTPIAPSSPDIFPSDHFGLAAEIEVARE